MITKEIEKINEELEIQSDIDEAGQRLAFQIEENRLALSIWRRTDNYKFGRGWEKRAYALAAHTRGQDALYSAMIEWGAYLFKLYRKTGKSLSIEDILERHCPPGVTQRQLKDAIDQYPEWFWYARELGCSDMTVFRTGCFLEDLAREAGSGTNNTDQGAKQRELQLLEAISTTRYGLGLLKSLRSSVDLLHDEDPDLPDKDKRIIDRDQVIVEIVSAIERGLDKAEGKI